MTTVHVFETMTGDWCASNGLYTIYADSKEEVIKKWRENRKGERIKIIYC